MNNIPVGYEHFEEQFGREDKVFGLDKILGNNSDPEYGKDIPFTWVNCRMCEESYLWGLSWNGSKQRDFICDKCKEQIEEDHQPYKDDR